MPDGPDSLEAAARDRVGKTLCGKWTLERLVGVGGVAAVYAARHRNGRRVAVKVLHPELAVDSRMKKRFLREGYVANAVEHDGAVAVLDDAIEDDGSVFLVMELLEGETLEARCQRCGGQLEPAEALLITHTLLDVLASAHEHDVLHRDVTPSNVFVTSDGDVKLLDFGIARLRGPAAEGVTGSVPGALGTPGYMPPEQARGLWQELDSRSDLWAVGAVLYRLLVGRPVHRGRTPSETLLAAMTQRAAPLRDAIPDAADELSLLIARATAFEPAQRFADARTFQREVAAVYGAITGAEIDSAVLGPAPPADSASVEGMEGTQAGAFGTTVRATSGRAPSWLRPALISATLTLMLASGAFVAFGRNVESKRFQRASAQPQASTPASTPARKAKPLVAPAASAPTPRASTSEAIARTPPPRATAPRVLVPSVKTPKKPAARKSANPEDELLDQRK